MTIVEVVKPEHDPRLMFAIIAATLGFIYAVALGIKG